MGAMNSDLQIAVAWYDKSEWTIWKTVCSDGDTFFGVPYETWLECATTAKEDQEALGRTVIAVPTGIADLLGGAEQNQRGTGADARSAFSACFA